MVIRQGPHVYAKAGLHDRWTHEADSAIDIQSAGTRIGMRDANHELWVKDGLNGTWHDEAGNVDQYVVGG